MTVSKPIFAVIVFIATLFLAFVFAVPEYQQSLSLQNTLAQKQWQYNNESLYYQKVTQLSEVLNNNSDALQKVDAALPPSFSTASLVYFLQNDAAENGLVIKLITFSQIPAPSSDGTIKNITFIMNMTGSYQGFKSFLAALDTSARLFEVNSVSFNYQNADTAGGVRGAGSKPQQQQIYNFNLQVQTHSY